MAEWSAGGLVPVTPQRAAHSAVSTIKLFATAQKLSRKIPSRESLIWSKTTIISHMYSWTDAGFPNTSGLLVHLWTAYPFDARSLKLVNQIIAA